MAEIYETELPGVGVRHEFDTNAGDRIGVLVTRTGRRELLLYDDQDPDACRDVLVLDESESRLLGDLLGVSRISESIRSLQQVEGLIIDWLQVQPGSKVAGHPIGDSEIRSSTGASVIARLRAGEALPAPGPEDELLPGDIAVVIGDRAAIDAVTRLLQPD